MILIGLYDALNRNKIELALKLLYEMAYKICINKNGHKRNQGRVNNFYDLQCKNERGKLRLAYKSWVKNNDYSSKSSYLEIKSKYNRLIQNQKKIILYKRTKSNKWMGRGKEMGKVQN